MDYTLYVEKTTGGSSGGSSSGGSGGSTSSGSGGKTGGSGGKTGGSGSSSGSNTGGSKTGGSNSSSSGAKAPLIKKPKDLAKLPPVHVQQPDGSMLALNMQDFCVLPNASAINTVAYQQCLARKKRGDDDDMPIWLIVLIIAIIVALVVSLIAMLARD